MSVEFVLSIQTHRQRKKPNILLQGFSWWLGLKYVTLEISLMPIVHHFSILVYNCFMEDSHPIVGPKTDVTQLFLVAFDNVRLIQLIFCACHELNSWAQKRSHYLQREGSFWWMPILNLQSRVCFDINFIDSIDLYITYCQVHYS